MKTANHTPGPWEAHENGHIYAEERASAVARIFENSYHRDGEAQANARLIAAAPDMLAALERFDVYLDRFTDCEGSDLTGAYLSYEGQQAIAAARAAINKAKGTK